jgi:hypothetical protein
MGSALLAGCLALTFLVWTIVSLREQGLERTCLRLVLAVFFTRYGLSLWKAAGHDIGVLSFVNKPEAIFANVLMLFIFSAGTFGVQLYREYGR